MQRPPSPTALRVADLPQNTETRFGLRPDAGALDEIARELGLLKLRKLSFEGTVTAEGRADWRLQGKLGATVTQPCGITLEPVTTRIDVPVTRLYQRDYREPEATEAEIPEDDGIEPLSQWIDPGAVMLEALDLNLPLYPRLPDAELGEMVVTEPGVEPMREEDAKPFAGLASLKDRLGKPDTE